MIVLRALARESISLTIKVLSECRAVALNISATALYLLFHILRIPCDLFPAVD